MISSHRITKAEAATAIAARWGLAPRDLLGERPPDALIGEYVRATLSAQCNSGPTQTEPVYVTTITNRVRDQLSLLWPSLRGTGSGPGQEDEEADEDPIRAALEGLEVLRDCEHVGQGYWLPTPTRLVALDSEIALVVSGRPTQEVEDELGCDLKRSGLARILDRCALPEEWTTDERKWQSCDTWMGRPPASLSVWLRGERKRALGQMAPSAAESGDFEIYSPAVATPAQPQWFRWMPSKKLLDVPEGPVLCRRRGGYFGQLRYWWGRLTVADSEPRTVTEAPVGAESLRRIQYALDAEVGNPTAIKVESAEGAVTLTLRSVLPPEERRLFFALATEVSETSNPYPIRLRVPMSHLRAVEEAIRGLGIELT